MYIRLSPYNIDVAATITVPVRGIDGIVPGAALYYSGVATNPASACQLAALLPSASGPFRGGPWASVQRLGPTAYGISDERRGRVGVARRALRWRAPRRGWPQRAA